MRRAVAFYLPTDGASAVARAASDRGKGAASKSHSVDDISFVQGKMAVRHREHAGV